MTKILLIIFTCFLIFFSCENDKELLSPPTNPATPSIPHVPLIINPDSGVFGDTLSISGPNFAENDYHYLEFQNLSRQREFSGDSLKLYFYVPFGALSGYTCFTNSEIADSSHYFKVLEDIPDSIRVIPSNLNFTIQESESWAENDRWEGEIKSDTIILKRNIAGDCCHTEQYIKFKHRDSLSLPAIYIIYWKYWAMWEDERSDTLSYGIVKLQEYDPAGIICGRVYGDIFEYYPLTFWFDFSNSPSEDNAFKFQNNE